MISGLFFACMNTTARSFCPETDRKRVESRAGLALANLKYSPARVEATTGDNRRAARAPALKVLTQGDTPGGGFVVVAN
jgi:hypothetical protein